MGIPFREYGVDALRTPLAPALHRLLFLCRPTSRRRGIREPNPNSGQIILHMAGKVMRRRGARAGRLDNQGSTGMNLIISLIIGGVVGWLASIVMKTNAQMGWIANVLVGVGGSVLGYWIAGLLGIAPAGGILRFVVAVAGAVLLIFILRKLGVFRKA